MRIKWSVKQMSLAALLCFAVGTAGLLILFQWGALEDQSVPIDLEETFDSSAIHSVRISTDVTNTTFVRSASGNLVIRLSGNINKADLPYAGIELSPDTGASLVDATIRTSKRFQTGIDVNRLFFSLRQGFRSDLKVVVELPEKPYKELRAKTDTGKLSLPVIQAGTLELRSDTGDISLEGFTGRRLAVSSDTGSLRLKHVAAELDLQSDTGDFYVELDSLPAGANLRTDTGDIHLTMNGAFPIEVDFQTDTGKTSASSDEGNFAFEWREKHKLRGKLGQGGPLVKARSDTGDIVLEGR